MSEDDAARGALRDRYALLMSVRPGETIADAEARRAAAAWAGFHRILGSRREKVRTANSWLIDLGIGTDERIALIRATLLPSYSFLAAEVVHGRPPSEDLAAAFAEVRRELGDD